MSQSKLNNVSKFLLDVKEATLIVNILLKEVDIFGIQKIKAYILNLRQR